MRAAWIVWVFCVGSVIACSSNGGGAPSADATDGGAGNTSKRGTAGSVHATGGAGGTAGTKGAAGMGNAAAGAGGQKAGSSGQGASGAPGTAGTPGTPGTPGQIGGCSVFTADDAWNRDISAAEVDSDWTTKLQALVGNVKLHPDYGNSGSEHYGIPINVVPKAQAAVDVTFDAYPEESDPGPYPFPDPSTAKIEGGTPQACDGDCHFLVVQSGSCMLYEGYGCSYDNGWRCQNGAKWDLTKNSYAQRTKGWTSADAAGLAITPGLVRYDEVKAGNVPHAIRFTVQCTRANFVAPATHQAVPGKCSDPNAPPMGLRVRMKADYDLSKLSASAQVVARAMQHYGLILADNGSNFYFQGEDNPGWTETDVEPLKTIPASAFEALKPAALEK